MKQPLAVVTDEQENQEKAVQPPQVWRETRLTESVLFRARDEAGRSGWFLRLTVSGLYPRRVGPFRTQREAIEGLEAFISDIHESALCNLQNNLQCHQTCLVEGAPPLMPARSREETPC